MIDLEEWLSARGPAVAQALDQQRESLCARVSTYLAETYPSLGYDPKRRDAIAFQQKTFRETPRRFHQILQTALQFRTLTVIEREYRWGHDLLQRYHVTQHHLRAPVTQYFAAARALVALDDSDQHGLDEVEATILAMIKRVGDE